MLQMFQRRGSFRSEVVGGKLPAVKYLLRFAARGRGRKIVQLNPARSNNKSNLPQEDYWTCYTLTY